MFFSTNLQASDIAETVRKTDSTIICAKTLRHECEMFNFSLENSLKDGNDLIQSYQLYKNNRPTEWQKFFKTLLKQSQISTEKQIVCAMIFQIVFSLILGDTKMTPFTIELTHLIHNTCRSKYLITVFNRLGLCTGYDSMQRIDTSLTQRIINQAVGHRVPVSSEITSTNIIHGAIDNYDDNFSHDTILMLFQNQSDPGQSTEPQSSQSDNQQASRKRITILDCQKLVSRTKTKGIGIIPVDFTTTPEIPAIFKGKFADDHFQWLFLRYKSSPDKTKETNNQTIPSFSSLKSILSETSVNITHITFTPILPYPATNYDAVYTVLVNFQDVLKRKQQVSGALWCDEGVYHIAKELQLL